MVKMMTVLIIMSMMTVIAMIRTIMTIMNMITMVALMTVVPMTRRNIGNVIQYRVMSSGPRLIRTSRLLRWRLVLWVLLAREPPGLRLGAGGTVKEFVVDTGCQETMIGTSVGERIYSFPLVAPDALWGRDALKLTCDTVRSNAGQAVWWQKCLYDPRAVNRIFTFGDWTVRLWPSVFQCWSGCATTETPLWSVGCESHFYILWLDPPAVTCKLDSPWFSPYLLVSLCGWAVGVQLQPDSAIFFIHYQALEKIPQPRRLVSSLSWCYRVCCRVTVCHYSITTWNQAGYSAPLPDVCPHNSGRLLSSGAALGYSRLLPGWYCSGEVSGPSRNLSGMQIQPAVSPRIRQSPVGFKLSAHRGLRVSFVKPLSPLSQPASSDPGELITECFLIDVSGPALCTDGQLVHPGAVLFMSCRAGDGAGCYRQPMHRYWEVDSWLAIGSDLWRGRRRLWLLQSAWRRTLLSDTSAAVADSIQGSLVLIGDQLTSYCWPGNICSWLSCVVWLIYISACCGLVGLLRIVCPVYSGFSMWL